MLRHILNSHDITPNEIEYILKVANNIAVNSTIYEKVASGKILATLFFEPSTRTRLSFESAMMRMGGKVIGFADMSNSSAQKGESIEDTCRTVSCYSDIISVRHPVALSPHKMSTVASVPVINAGDGSNEHPTQTLTDLVTINQKFKRLDNLTVGLCGDLKFGRTVHSLIKILSRYPNNRFVLIAPDALKMPEHIIEMLEEKNIDYTVTDDLQASISELDILYMTRIQKERFDSVKEYEQLKGVYVLDSEKMQYAKEDMIIMHPFPRVDEIHTDVDGDPRAWYFKQMQYGVYARMALIIMLLELDDMLGDEEDFYVHTASELNPRRLPVGA